MAASWYSILPLPSSEYSDSDSPSNPFTFSVHLFIASGAAPTAAGLLLFPLVSPPLPARHTPRVINALLMDRRGAECGCFAREATVPYAAAETLLLHVFVDEASVELFVDEGRRVLTEGARTDASPSPSRVKPPTSRRVGCPAMIGHTPTAS